MSRIVGSITLLQSLSAGFDSSLGNLIYRLLLLRLQEGPRIGWETVDDALRQTFTASVPLHILPLGQNIVAALDILRTETWGDAGNDLRVRVK